MAANGKAAPEAEPAPAKPAIVLEFAGPGQAQLTVRMAGISPGQVYLAAWFLDAMAREIRQGEVTQATLGQAIPAPDAFLDALRRAGRV